MTDTATPSAAQLEAPRATWLHEGRTLRSFLLTTDHKRVALLYFIAVTGFFLIGSAAMAVIRLELLTPQADLVTRHTYNRLFTLHGTIMVWFVLIPVVPNVLGNFLLPLMLGARDLAFPRLNLASWYLFMAGGVLSLVSMLVGGVDTGWTFYTPYSTAFSNSWVFPMAAGIFVAGFSSVLTGLNFIVTTHTLRAPGLTWFRLPLFVWSLYATSLILVLATPVLTIALALMALERVWGVGVFDPRLGGDPLLWQHLFWFYSHPAVYVMILPGMGIVSELIACFARKRIFGYRFIAYSSLSIALLGFLVWGHHMFVSGQSMYASLTFSLLSFLVAVPSAIKVFNWTCTLHKASIVFKTPFLYALGFVGLFTGGGLTGLVLSNLAVDVHVHDTTFVVAHFHTIMVGGMISAWLGGLHFWWPKMTGRMYSEPLGVVSALLMFLGFNLTFFPQFVLGYMGMPRRYASYAPEFQPWHVLSSAGASLLAVAYALPMLYLTWSWFRGAPAPDNPWGALGLEWQTRSPPPPHNFDQPPRVGDPYAYRTPGAEEPEADHA